MGSEFKKYWAVARSKKDRFWIFEHKESANIEALEGLDPFEVVILPVKEFEAHNRALAREAFNAALHVPCVGGHGERQKADMSDFETYSNERLKEKTDDEEDNPNSH